MPTLQEWTWVKPKAKDRKPATFICPYCAGDVVVAASEAMIVDDITGMPKYHIYKCPRCHMPVTIAPDGSTIPPSLFLPFGEIGCLPSKIKQMYAECRESFANRGYYSVILVAHSLMVQIAIDKGADTNKGNKYVDYLKKNGYIAEQEKVWVDKIRELGDHYINDTDEATKKDAERTIIFVSQILRNIYELPEMAREG